MTLNFAHRGFSGQFPENTMLAFEKAVEGEDKLLTAKNKWLIGHEEAAIEGAFNGLKGENVGID